MVEKSGIVQNECGIHLRPATSLSKMVKDYAGTVSIANAYGLEVSPYSVLSILSLALLKGDTVIVKVTGPDEEAFCNRIVAFLEEPLNYK